MKRRSYREQDYAFEQTMLSLRKSIRLTQAGLAELLGSPAVPWGEWERGLNSPQPEHLQHVPGLCVRASVFAPGRHACLEGRPVL